MCSNWGVCCHGKVKLLHLTVISFLTFFFTVIIQVKILKHSFVLMVAGVGGALPDHQGWAWCQWATGGGPEGKRVSRSDWAGQAQHPAGERKVQGQWAALTGGGVGCNAPLFLHWSNRTREPLLCCTSVGKNGHRQSWMLCFILKPYTRVTSFIHMFVSRMCLLCPLCQVRGKIGMRYSCSNTFEMPSAGACLTM